MSERLDAATRDEIDDRVAEVLDVYLAERRPEPAGGGSGVLLGSLVLGAVVTAVASSAGVLVLCAMWVAIAVADVAWFVTHRRS